MNLLLTKDRLISVLNYLRLFFVKIKLKIQYYLASKDLVVNKNNYFIRFHNDGDNQEVLYLGNWDKYFNEEYPVLNQSLKSGDNVVDVGANLGFFSLMISKLIGSEGKVFGFEPSKITYDKLQTNLKLNSILNVYPENLGVGQKDCVLTLKRNKKYSGLSSIILEQNTDIVEERIKITSLDNYFFNKNIKIDLIKIDTEGFEPEVLKGAKQIIMKYKPLIYIELGGGKFLNSSIEAINILLDYNYNLPINKNDLNLISSGKNFIANPI